MNINHYTTGVQSYVAVLKIIQNTEQNDEQNTNDACKNIPVFNNFFDLLKPPFLENENGFF